MTPGRWQQRLGWLGVLGASACHSLPTQVDQPALIREPTAASQAELRAVLHEALGDNEIRLAPDALTRSSILALEQGASAPPAARGRILELPERFELVLNGTRCYLIRSTTGQRYELEQTDCVPAEL